VNNISSASQSTSLQSSSTVSAQASQDGDGTVNVHAEQGVDQSNDIGGSITDQVSQETESTTLNGDFGGISESRARQCGEQKKVGTHS
jgi:hypothetical protein